MKNTTQTRTFAPAVLEEWHRSGRVPHQWNEANSESMKSCRVCGVNKSTGGAGTRCQGMSFGDWTRARGHKPTIRRRGNHA